MAASSNTTESAIASGANDVACGSASSVTAIASPPRNFAEGSVAATASTVTWPASIQPFSRLRECCGSNCASTWSSRSPAAASGTVNAWRNDVAEEGEAGSMGRL